jgi:glucokinase
VDASALSTVGIDVGGTKIAGARLDPGGVVAASLEVPTDLSSSDAILGQIAALVAELTADVEPVLGVGVGIPGTINQREGRLLQAVNTPLADIAVRSRLEELTGLRVIIDNDANCAALGEHVHGAAGPYSHSILLTLGTGVGGGMVFDGRVFRGASGAGGELGHIVIDRDGRSCQGSCPGRGHLETFCSGTGLGRSARAHVAVEPDGTLARALEPGQQPDARFVLARLAEGDAEAAALVEDLGRALGAGLVSLANTFAPSVFVIGGGFGEAAGDAVLDPARGVLVEQALHPMNRTPVVMAKLGGDAGVIGAAELLRSDLA